MAKDTSSTAQFVTVFVAVLLGVVLLGALAGVMLSNTQLTGTSETINIAPARLSGGTINTTYPFTLTNAPTGWRAGDSACYIQGLVYSNSTGPFTLTTDYTFTDSTGVLLLKNTASVNSSASNTTTAAYQYCGSDYLSVSWERSIVGLIAGLLALGILVYVVFWAIKRFGDTE